ncbi:TIGR02117 family protein [Sphingomonas sp. ac-8]|uniref:TIGR02117 family protein n=1 Tax=Sphingomonas sp. ac-8 TaxID=3242977 RepID=UPI003A813BDD
MPTAIPLRRAARAVRILLATVVVVLLGYGLAGLIGGAIPVHRAWQAPEDGVRIYVEDNGIHTGIVVPVSAVGVDWRDLVRPEHLRDPRYAGHSHLSIGWGDRAFYVGTPTWGDLKPSTVLRAAFGSEDTVLHVGHLPEPRAGEPGVRALVLRPAEYRRLADFIRSSFSTGPDGLAGSVPGYGRADAFYTAHGHYSALRTCNSWTGEALRHAGVRMGAWTPFPVTVMRWLP